VQLDGQLAHTLALLYPIGQLLMHQSLPDDMAALDRQAHPRLSKFASNLGFLVSCFWIQADKKMFSIDVDQPDTLPRGRPCPNDQS